MFVMKKKIVISNKSIISLSLLSLFVCTVLRWMKRSCVGKTFETANALVVCRQSTAWHSQDLNKIF